MPATPGNSLNITAAGLVKFDGTATFSGVTTTQFDVLVGGATNGISSVGPGSTGQVLQSGGNAANPAYSTATYPVTATGTGTLLRADGTNWVATTSTYPNTNAISTLLYASASNVMSALATANSSVLITNSSGVPSLGTSLVNDFTYTSAVAGGTRTLTISNTDNTNAASAATVITSTGGASSGDASYQASTTTTTWIWGVDNSVTSPTADPFVIAQGTALGTNNVMSVDTAGAINYPLQPSFLAVLNTTINDVTGDGTNYKIVFDTEIYDQGSNAVSGTFTAPVTGRYLFTGGCQVDGLTSSHTQEVLNLTASNRTLGLLNGNPLNMKVGGISFGYAAGNYVDMDAADTCSLNVIVFNGAKVVDIDGNGSTTPTTYFGGALTC